MGSWVRWHTVPGNKLERERDIKLSSSCPDVALLPDTRALNEPSLREDFTLPTRIFSLLRLYAIKAPNLSKWAVDVIWDADAKIIRDRWL